MTWSSLYAFGQALLTYLDRLLGWFFAPPTGVWAGIFNNLTSWLQFDNTTGLPWILFIILIMFSSGIMLKIVKSVLSSFGGELLALLLV